MGEKTLPGQSRLLPACGRFEFCPGSWKFRRTEGDSGPDADGPRASSASESQRQSLERSPAFHGPSEEGIGLVGYAQKKPLDEYRKQAFSLFSDLMDRISNEAVSTFYKLTLANPVAEPIRPVQAEQQMEFIHGEVPETERN